MANVRILLAAEADIEQALSHTLARFGVHKYDDYAALIEEALEALATDPRAGRKRPDIDPAAWIYRIGKHGCRDDPRVRVRNRAEREGGLRPAAQRAPELGGERAHDLGTEPPIVTEQRAKARGRDRCVARVDGTPRARPHNHQRRERSGTSRSDCTPGTNLTAAPDVRWEAQGIECRVATLYITGRRGVLLRFVRLRLR